MLVTLSLLFNSLGLAYAKSINMPNELYCKYIPNINSSSSNYSNISKTFEINENQIDELIIGSKIEYDIKINDTKNNSSYVVMNGRLLLNNNETYKFETKGEVDKINIGNKTLLNGPLNGYMLINDEKVDLTIHFQKFQEANEIFITMSIYDIGKDINSFLAFGDKIVTKDFTDKIKSMLSEEESKTHATVNAKRSSTDNYNLAATNTNTGVTVDFWKSALPLPQTVQLQVYSDEDAVKNMYNNALFAIAYDAKVRLTADGGIFQIIGTSPSEKEEKSYDDILMPLLSDVLGKYGVPTSVLIAILGNDSNRGRIIVDNNIYDTTIEVYSTTRLNIGIHPFPFFFAVNVGNGNARGTFGGLVKYKGYYSDDSYYYHTASTSMMAFSEFIPRPTSR
jgi:hypothetical protein